MDTFLQKAENFISEMPYRRSPYCGRNWGHPWHSLCSYHGKLKPAIAHFLISEFTREGDIVLDPLCGVGTIPFEASLQGRIGIGNDLSELAYCVTKAKLEKPEYNSVQKEILKLEKYIESNKDKYNTDDLPYSSFGLNHKLCEYFHPETFKEILIAREYFLSNYSRITSAKAMTFSALLHVLHGNRPYALSRISHPLTPYAPRGEYIYKNVVDHIRAKIEIAYTCIQFDNYMQGKAMWGDFKKIKKIGADVIITSPPFADSMRFYSQNWMRLWLCGWEPDDFKAATHRFLDQQQNKSFDVYVPFFEMCAKNLKPDGKIILHLGKTERVNMADELAVRAETWFEEVYRGDENVSELEKHGIKDKGGTTEHQFLFMKRK